MNVIFGALNRVSRARSKNPKFTASGLACLARFAAAVTYMPIVRPIQSARSAK